jgi:tetratricopeptide (TPR) repeat protein
LGVFSAGFTLEAVEQVVEPKDDKQVEILEQLAQLVDKSLVMVDERKGAHRYKLLETVRQYGLKQLQEEGELESARNAHLHYFTQLAECQDPGLRSTQQIDSLAVLDADHDNLRRALRWALNSQIPDMAFRLIGALGWYWFMRGYWKESKVWLLESLENTQDLEPIFKAKAINRSGGLEIIRGKVAGRIELVEEALQICREHNDLEGMAWSLNLIGQAGTWGMRDLAIAGDNLSESIQLFTQIEDDWGIAWSTRYLGQIAELSGDFEKSISLQKEALEIFEQIGDHWNSAHSLYLMGGSYFAAGYFDEARAAYEQSLERCEQVEDKVMNAHAIRGLAQLAIHNNELDQAEHLAQEALEELKKFGDENCAAGALRLLGEIYRIQGDIDHAAIMFNESLDTFHSLGNLAPICLVLDRFAGLAVATGDYDEAVKLLAFVEENIGEFLKVSPTFEEEHKQLVSSAREMLGDHDFNQIWSEGLEMNLEAVILLAKKKNPQ